MPARLFDTRIDIPVATRTEMVELLNARLADASDLYSQTKQAHWNVKGSDFIQLHELFDSLAGTVLGFVDLIAERATALGGEALGTVRMAAATSSLDEFPRDSYDGMDAVDTLASAYATFGRAVRAAAEAADAAGDMDTNDLFVEISRGIDKSLWFLEAHLQKAR
jgi:starvation-inducible DNA-binding protein